MAMLMSLPSPSPPIFLPRIAQASQDLSWSPAQPKEQMVDFSCTIDASWRSAKPRPLSLQGSGQNQARLPSSSTSIPTKMRFSSYALPALAANLVAALPAPQDIDLDMVEAAPDPTYTQTLGLTAQIVTYDTTAILAEATAAATVTSVAVDDVLDGTAIVSKRQVAPSTSSEGEANPTSSSSDEGAAPSSWFDERVGIWVTTSPTPTANEKRNIVARGAACTALPTGIASYALSADTASDFRANGSWASIASEAPVPSGYVNTVVNAAGANSGYGYLGYSNLNSYDTNACAAKCSKTIGCMAFNIYFERDPSVDPGTGNSGCANPSSVVYAKCALWGGPLNTANANNKGQMRNQFEVAVAGSNAYQNNSLTIPAGYSLKAAYNNVAINAPYDAQGFNTYMGATIFTKGPFNIQLCADYCSAQTKYNLANPASDGTPPKSCNFFNTYILYKNDAGSPQGQYCSIYTEQWSDSYAVNSGQTRGSDRYFIGYSYTFSNSSSAGIAPKVGDKNGAIYQARQDMTYYPSQLTSTFQPFCSSVLGYTVPVASVTALTTVTPVVSSTVYSTLTVTANIANAKRAAASLATPDVLTKYPSSVFASACSLIATSPTFTSTITAATSTATAAASTTLVTKVSTTTVARYTQTGYLKIKGGTSDGQYLGKGFSSGIPSLSSSSADRVLCGLDSAGRLYCNNLLGNIVGTYLYWQFRSDIQQVGDWTPTCSTDSTGLLTCSKVNSNWVDVNYGVKSNAPYGNSWVSCVYDKSRGTTLHYSEHSAGPVSSSCQSVSVYMVPA
ncbi:hypothetical protein E4T52_00888 [Aureobasidium sp. EXF-3400]|nr:hypothetical protein E4T51_00685 [Aureobasidium sp. EXF-12344]KAI4784252.1 hypothetical protein E4T52_00888 [Aureobasidium sp. EXF-3400]